MTETNLPLVELKEKKEKKCKHTVGTYNCINCVINGKCPSNFTKVAQIGKVESGRDYCYGRQ